MNFAELGYALNLRRHGGSSARNKAQFSSNPFGFQIFDTQYFKDSWLVRELAMDGFEIIAHVLSPSGTEITQTP